MADENSAYVTEIELRLDDCDIGCT